LPGAEAEKTSEAKELLAMRAAIFKGPEAVEVGERPDPAIQEPTDAVVRVVRGRTGGRIHGQP
jgi:hypothetical protein